MVSKGRSLQPHEKIEIAKRVCDLYATDQFTLVACLSQEGIKSESTWHKWCSEIEEIEELYKEAQKQKRLTYETSLVERAETALENYLTGFTKSLLEQETIPGKDENSYMVTKQKRKQVYIKPSMRAIEFVLTNLKGNIYTRNPEPTKAGNEKMPTDIRIEIINPTEPITSEDDIDEDIS